jgi:CBS domain containing-hemolysin-like protein
MMLESAAILSSEEQAMINRVLDLQSLTVRTLARPLDGVPTVTARTPMGEVLQLCRDQGVTRVPVWQIEGDSRKIVGLIALRSVIYHADLDPGRTAGEYVRPALYLEDHLRLETALQRMRRGGQRMAIVLGQDRREQGVVSLQDIIRFIFGELSE